MDTLEKSVELFLEKKYRRNNRDRRTARNLLLDKSTSFLKQPSLITYLDRPITDREVIENIPIAIKDVVTSYTKDKNTAISILKAYLNFLKKQYGVEVAIEFPPTFNSQFDRQMYIVKSLHKRDYRALDFADELWVSDRTINTDLQQLEDGITILGQNLEIKKQDVVYKKDGLNTVHPIFLVANLTQIVILLRGLEQQSQDQAYCEYAVRLAANIWSELSDYGRERIIEVSGQLNLNTAWFNLLEERRNKALYSTEAHCSYNQGVGNVLDFLKNGKLCAIEIQNEHGTEILEDCLIKNHSSGDHITVEHQGQELVIPVDSVISASEYGKCIY
ncbi:MAG TPA: hypothetical protein GXX58_03520 [Gelria sp.]|nr:hypothetical protein [Gelria sp.]